MKKFAVAYLWNFIPRHDTIKYDKGVIRFFRGEEEVWTFSEIYPVSPARFLSIDIVEAENEKQAAEKVLERTPKTILMLAVKEVS